MKLALTGGIGCGKSSVAQYFHSLCGGILTDADQVCADLLQKDEAGWVGVQKSLGKRFIGKNGEIDRPLLRETIFSDKAIRQQLEKILHPLVRKRFKRCGEASRQRGEILIFEVPLLFEVGWQEDFDHIVTVYADRRIVIERICRRDLVSREHAMSIVQAQMPLKDKIDLSDSVIDNSGYWGDTCLQLCHLRDLLLKNR
jgi:dephospho-CoA kinase